MKGHLTDYRQILMNPLTPNQQAETRVHGYRGRGEGRHVEVKHVRRLITPTLVLSMVMKISCGCIDIKIEGLHWNPHDECLWIRGWYLERPVNLP